MKANDNIPADEMLLAEAIAAAKARRLRGTAGAAFRDRNNIRLSSSRGARSCCALGGLALAGRLPETKAIHADTFGTDLRGVHLGNDMTYWDCTPRDYGESLGWAFRCAMTQEDE